MKITVNGAPLEFRSASISYEDVLRLARTPEGRARLLHTVTFRARNADGMQRGGTLSPGQSMELENGMVFNAVVADST